MMIVFFPLINYDFIFHQLNPSFVVQPLFVPKGVKKIDSSHITTISTHITPDTTTGSGINPATITPEIFLSATAVHQIHQLV
jgi:hypothetical protein